MNETKEQQLIKKMGKDKYEWSYKVQTQPLPSWSAAFDYAYNLGLKAKQDKKK